MISLQYELINMNANEMIWKMNIYTRGNYRVSNQCELLNVSTNKMTGKTTLYNE